ncbi:MAG: DNA recombination protein RmuC [Burkholderiales bacterium]
MESIIPVILFGIAALMVVLAVGWLGVKVQKLILGTLELPVLVGQIMEDKHLNMLKDLNSGLNALGDRQTAMQVDLSERLRNGVSQDLKQSRDALLALQLSQTEELSSHREVLIQRLSALTLDMQTKHDALRTEMLTTLMHTLGEQNRAQQELLQNSLRTITQQVTSTIESLTRVVDGRLDQISGKVNERLDEGFKKTNETFANVMARLATIDEAQKKIDGLTTNMVSLQELLGDKRARGAFGEVQLEALVRNLLPSVAYEFQYTLSNGTRADCVLKLPEPTGLVAVDAKFPLENYHRMFDSDKSEIERAAAARQFRLDLRKHIEDIGNKYIIANETSDGAVLFLPAEAVFAEIHAHHQEIIDVAMQKRVWIVSPTTMMAVLNTARAVIKDVETRRQVHIIKDELGKLAKEFGRFDQRMRKLADHIRQAHQDAEDVRVTSDKITRRFAQIERVEFETALPSTDTAADVLLPLDEDAVPAVTASR